MKSRHLDTLLVGWAPRIICYSMVTPVYTMSDVGWKELKLMALRVKEQCELVGMYGMI